MSELYRKNETGVGVVYTKTDIAKELDKELEKAMSPVFEKYVQQSVLTPTEIAHAAMTMAPGLELDYLLGLNMFKRGRI